jgi:tRNA-dihydrouridine synthase A
MLNRKISIAPMMDCTDRHERFFLRLISPSILLYTEMVTTGALLYGDANRFLRFNAEEHPVALQLGGSQPAQLAQCALMGQDYGYDEVNLNVGCPSDKVKVGQFGACLMKTPNLVADCIHAMSSAVNIPVTVKCRIGIDDNDSYEELCHFIQQVSAAGCNVFVIHARKAWLNGLSPKQNREIPPLRYDIVAKIKKDFPQLTIILNGGLKTVADVHAQIQTVDGVMIGREAYANPYLLADLEREFYNPQYVLSRHEVIEKFLPYVELQLASGIRLASITRHIFGLFQATPGARKWRRYLSENACLPTAGIETIKKALNFLNAEKSQSYLGASVDVSNVV